MGAADADYGIVGIGAMLPDLWRMTDRRARARRGIVVASDADPVMRQLAIGVDHHLDVDAWFHAHPAFEEAVDDLARRIDDAGIEARKMRLLAHPLIEMALDGALLKRHGFESIRNRLARDRATVETARIHALLEDHLPRVDERRRTPTRNIASRTAQLLDEIAAGPWIAGYRDPDGLVDRLGGMRRRLRLPPLSPDDRTRLQSICRHAIASAQSELDTFLSQATALQATDVAGE